MQNDLKKIEQLKSTLTISEVHNAFEIFKKSDNIFDNSTAILQIIEANIKDHDFAQKKYEAMRLGNGFLFDPDVGFIVITNCPSPSWHSSLMTLLIQRKADTFAHGEFWLSFNDLRCFVSRIRQQTVFFYDNNVTDDIFSNRKIISKNFYDVGYISNAN